MNGWKGRKIKKYEWLEEKKDENMNGWKRRKMKI
jgi:hypothetical protein